MHRYVANGWLGGDIDVVYIRLIAADVFDEKATGFGNLFHKIKLFARL